MGTKDALERAVGLAIENGWETKWIGDFNRVYADVITGELFAEYIYQDQVWSYSITGILFADHDFTKALWGEESETRWDVTEGHGAAFQDSVNNWEYHLQQMVIAEDPIQYLKENI